MNGGGTAPELGGEDEQPIEMPAGAIRVPKTDRAAGLGHVRHGIRRRASLSPLIFLIAAAIVILVLAVANDDDDDGEDSGLMRPVVAVIGVTEAPPV